jgi:hypothetical protein
MPQPPQALQFHLLFRPTLIRDMQLLANLVHLSYHPLMLTLVSYGQICSAGLSQPAQLTLQQVLLILDVIHKLAVQVL